MMRAWTTVVVVASSESLYLKYIFEIQPTGVTNWMLGMRKKKKESRMIDLLGQIVYKRVYHTSPSVSLWP